MGVFEEFITGFTPFDLAIEAVVAGFEGHDPAVGFLVRVGIFEAGNVGMADVKWDSGEAAAEFSGEGMEVIDEGVSGGAVHALEAFAMGEIAVGRKLDPGVLEEDKRDGLSRGLISYFDSFFIHICVNLSRGGGSSAVPPSK